MKLFLKYAGFLSDISMGSIQATLRGKPAHFLVTRPWTTGANPGNFINARPRGSSRGGASNYVQEAYL